MNNTIFNETIKEKKDISTISVRKEKDETLLALKDLNNDHLRIRLDF
ncbi:MAG TPA: hypothetical protein PLV56_00610 [Synergistales bacterium]|nr:hypothetical protein [Synergistales bacterium]